MALSYKHTAMIDSRDVDGLGCCRASALMGHMQEAATQAAEHGGFGRDVLMRNHQGFWMLTRMWYRLERPLRWGEELTIHTWHRGAKGVVSYRDYDLYVGEELVGEGVSAWVLASMTDHKLMRLNGVSEMTHTHGGELCKDRTLSKLRAPEEVECVDHRLTRYSDTDINGHVNNTRYADFACDALRMDRLPEDQFLAEMQIGYLAECRAGEELEILSGMDKDGHIYVCGNDEGGKARFEASLRFRKK